MDGAKSFVRTGRPAKEPAVCGTARMYGRGCRCEACRAAFAVHQRARRVRLRTHGGDMVVSAELAREHLRRLSRQDVGMRAVADVTGISFQEIGRIRRGVKRRIRQSTEQRIMRVTTDCRADRSEIPAASTNRLIDRLRAQGYTLAELGRRLGYKGDTPQPQFYGKERITAINASRVERLYRLLTRKACVVDEVDRMMELAGRVA